jgi:hypothetical protein
MTNKEPIDYGYYYHIFNRGIDGQKIFRDKKDYQHFLNLMSIYLLPIANIYAYALLNNHFHLALSIKNIENIGYLSTKDYNSNDLNKKWKTYFPKNQEEVEEKRLYKKPVPIKMLQHFLNAYAKKFNSKYKRTGSLFEYKFKRIKIETDLYFRQLIIYTITP